MWFSMRRTDPNQHISAINGESSDLGTEAVSSTAANPADFQRVRFFCYNTCLTQCISSIKTIGTDSMISIPLIAAESNISTPSIMAESIISARSIMAGSIISTPSIAANTLVKRTFYQTLFRISPPRRRVVWVWFCVSSPNTLCAHGHPQPFIQTS